MSSSPSARWLSRLPLTASVARRAPFFQHFDESNRPVGRRNPKLRPVVWPLSASSPVKKKRERTRWSWPPSDVSTADRCVDAASRLDRCVEADRALADLFPAAPTGGELRGRNQRRTALNQLTDWTLVFAAVRPRAFVCVCVFVLASVVKEERSKRERERLG